MDGSVEQLHAIKGKPKKPEVIPINKAKMDKHEVDLWMMEDLGEDAEEYIEEDGDDDE